MSHVAPADAAHQCAARAPRCSLVGAAKALSISSRDADPSHLGWFVRPPLTWRTRGRACQATRSRPFARLLNGSACAAGMSSVSATRDTAHSADALETWKDGLASWDGALPSGEHRPSPHNIMPSTLDGSARLGHGAPAVAHVEQGSNPQPPVRAAADYGSVTCACAAGTSSASATRDAAHSAEALETWKDGLASWDGAIPNGEHRPSPTFRTLPSLTAALRLAAFPTPLVKDTVCGAPAVGVCPDSGRFCADLEPGRSRHGRPGPRVVARPNRGRAREVYESGRRPGPRWPLGANGFSFAFALGAKDAAYRRMACSQQCFTDLARWDPATRSVVYFGSRPSALACAPRLWRSTPIDAHAGHLRPQIGHLLTYCSGDFCCADPSFARGCQRTMRGAAERLDVELAGEWPGQEGSTSDGPGPVNTSLGVRHDFTRFVCERVSVASVDEAWLLGLASSKSYSSDRDSSRLPWCTHSGRVWAPSGSMWGSSMCGPPPTSRTGRLATN